MPQLGIVFLNNVYVPPYKLLDDTISSPLPAILRIESKMALIPVDCVNAPTPFSIAVTRFSKTSEVGFEILV